MKSPAPANTFKSLKPAHRDLLVLCAFAIVALAVAARFDVLDVLIDWYAQKAVPWELEEIVVVIFLMSFGFAAFAYRRWRELTVEVARSEQVEKALREKTEWLGTLMETLPNPLFHKDLWGRYTGCNRAFEDFVGKPRTEIVGRTAFELGAPRDVAAIYEQKDNELFRNPGRQIYEWVLRDRNGELRNALFHRAALSDSEGKVTGLVGIAVDITDHKRAQAALERSEKCLRRAEEVARLGNWEYHPGSREFRISDGVRRICGLTDDIRSPSEMKDVVLPAHREMLAEAVDALLAQGKPYNIEYKIRRPVDGNIVYIHAIAEYSKEKGAAFGVMQDITERKSAEEALRESEAFVKAIMDNLPIGVAVNVVDPFVRFSYMNDKFPIYYRATREALEDSFWEAAYEDSAFREEIRTRVLKDCNGGDPEAMNWTDVPITRKGEETSYVSARNIIVPEKNLMISIVWDVTERKKAEDERRRLEERLQRAEKMEALGTLAGGVAHDLNNVLGIIVGFSEILLFDLEDSSPLRVQVEEIFKGGQRAAAIVQDLLTLARRGVPTRRVLNLNTIIRECRRSAEFERLCSFHPGLQLRMDLEADLLNIAGSAVHLEKSFMNLIANAAESMAEGGLITVKTWNRYLDKPVLGYDEVKEGDYVVLSVSDEGEGIPPSDLKRIFEPFYTKKVMGRRSGTGLGLAVIWGTVKDHFGYINVESEMGRGSTFTVYIPVTREDIVPDQLSISLSDYMGRGETVLVVDDIQGQRDLAVAILEKMNYKVNAVSSGEEALEYLKEQRADLVLLDMIMEPGMDGLETYAAICAIHPKQKAIIVSGFAETDRVSKAQSLGAGAYLRKPYVLEKLVPAVREELDKPR